MNYVFSSFAAAAIITVPLSIKYPAMGVFAAGCLLLLQGSYRRRNYPAMPVAAGLSRAEKLGLAA